MNLWLRLLTVLIAACFARRQGLLCTSMLRFRVWPHDLDLNMHMNNARYLSLMDLGRVDLICRSDLLRVIAAKRWQAVIGGAMVRFRWPLTLFQSFTLSSRILGWDERWFYIEQSFTAGEGLAALGWVKGLLRSPQGNLDPQKVIETVSPGAVSPPMPEPIAMWNDLTREKLQSGA